VFFEYALDIMKLARRAGLYNVWVSNGYINPEPTGLAAKYLDAINLDLKGDGKFYKTVCAVPDHRPILEAAKLFKKKGVFLEATNLVIPGYNDKDSQIRELAAWVKKNLGSSTPLHFSRFYPCYRMEGARPTPEKTLDRAWNIARKAGLNYVYVGNVPGHAKENTYCPKCGELVIKRTGYYIESIKEKCPKCREKIPLAGKKWMKAKL
jgi:pyruvate formate lyase activating enzyme